MRTADGSMRASVPLSRIDTLWINTGTLCNLACVNCYIESTPKNDSLVYIRHAEVVPFFDELERDFSAREIGFTGGEPFMNPEFVAMLEDALSRGFRVLVLTNAMKPMMHKQDQLIGLRDRFGDRLTLRVSLDHFAEDLHDAERGAGSFEIAKKGIAWLGKQGFNVAIAGRTCWGEDENTARAGYARLARDLGLALDVDDASSLMLFPEMKPDEEPPEITTACWNILGKRPDDIMCASSRMVVKRKGAAKPVVLACTLIAYDARFEMGQTLKEAAKPVHLAHRYCASFCVLGGGSCSA